MLQGIAGRPVAGGVNLDFGAQNLLAPFGGRSPAAAGPHSGAFGSSNSSRLNPLSQTE